MSKFNCLSMLLLAMLSGCGDRERQSVQGSEAASPAEEVLAAQPAVVSRDSVVAFDAKRRSAATWTGMGCALNSPDDAKSIIGSVGDVKTFEGYFLGKDKESPNEFLFVLLGEKDSYSVALKPNVIRPDVAEYFKSPQGDHSGFSVSIPLSAVNPGTYSVDFFYTVGESDFFCESGKSLTVQ